MVIKMLRNTKNMLFMLNALDVHTMGKWLESPLLQSVDWHTLIEQSCVTCMRPYKLNYYPLTYSVGRWGFISFIMTGLLK